MTQKERNAQVEKMEVCKGDILRTLSENKRRVVYLASVKLPPTGSQPCHPNARVLCFYVDKI